MAGIEPASKRVANKSTSIYNKYQDIRADSRLCLLYILFANLRSLESLIIVASYFIFKFNNVEASDLKSSVSKFAESLDFRILSPTKEEI